jgi:DNA-binding TFAR19-related protein (PDSD5 family)
MEEDTDLRLIERRKLEEMRRRLKAAAPKPLAERTDRQVVEGVLVDRGQEVLDASYEFFPKETEGVVAEIAGMVRSGRLKGTITGGELLSVLRQLGLRVRLRTSIRVEDRGKLVELSEKLGRREDP